MTGAPAIRPGSAEGAAPGRSPGGKFARAGEKPATAFDALLSGMEPKSGARPAAPRDAPQLDRFFDLRGASPAPLSVLSVENAEAGQDVLALESTAQGQSLAEGVAERIAATLAGGHAKDALAGPLTEGRSAGVEGRREGALAASVAAAVSLARRSDAAGVPSRGAPTPISVTYRETVFAVPTMLSGGAQSLGGGSAPSASGSAALGVSLRGAEGLRSAEPGAGRQGRPEQLMLDERPSAGRGAMASAKAPAAAASTLVRAAEEVRTPAVPASGDAAIAATAEESPLAVLGGADQRTSGTALAAAAPAAQTAAAPPTFSLAQGAVKVLHIQLHPAELGTLEVRMRMGDGGLEVHIEASRPETAALLKSDRDTLESVLRGAGHSLDTVTVTVADKSGDASGQTSRDGQSSAFGARAEAQPGSPREQGGRFDDRSPSRPDGRATERVNDDEYQSAVAVRHRGGLYL